MCWGVGELGNSPFRISISPLNVLYSIESSISLTRSTFDLALASQVQSEGGNNHPVNIWGKVGHMDQGGSRGQALQSGMVG